MVPIVACSPLLDSASVSLRALAEFANAAESAGADLLSLRECDGFDPLSAAAALVPLTQRIGLGAAATTRYGEPFTLARGFAALDHLSGGRAAWEVLCGPLPDETARAREHVDVTCQLWESWQADALIFDKPSAIFSDTSKVRRIGHEGASFQVRGPLNTPRPPQGRLPLIVTADADESVINLADLVILDTASLETALTMRQRLKAMADKRDGKIALLAVVSHETLARAGWLEKGGCDGFVLQAPLTATRELAQMIAALPTGGGPRGGPLRERLELAPSGGPRP